MTVCVPKMGKLIGACILASVLFASATSSQYTPPDATVEPLSPRGIRISIPDEDGIRLVAFHVKINEDFYGLEAGTIAVDITKVRNGRWTYQDKTTKLRLGDIVYYWVHVVYEGLGYNLLDQQHQVTEFFDPEGNKVSPVPTPGGNKPGTGNGPCAPTDTKVLDTATGGRKDVCAGQLLLEDQFAMLNETLWRQIEKFTGPPDYGFVVYRNSRRNVKTVNANLQITPTLMESEFGRDFIRHGNLTLERCTESFGTPDCERRGVGFHILPPVISGSIDTKNSFAFLYGKVEIRAKLPRGDWINPILTLEPCESSSNLGSWTSYPSMRVASSFGNAVLRDPSGTDLSGHVVCGGPVETNSGGQRLTSMPKRYGSNRWSDDYHVYELEWRRNKILTRVDGIEYGSTDTRPPFDKPFYLHLGVAVGGHTDFPDMSMSSGYTKPWRNVNPKGLFDFFNATELWASTWTADAISMNVDYVKVWAL